MVVIKTQTAFINTTPSGYETLHQTSESPPESLVSGSGIKPLERYRFVEDNWETQQLVRLVLAGKFGLTQAEITQFTYFQQVGGLATGPVTSEVTYG